MLEMNMNRFDVCVEIWEKQNGNWVVIFGALRKYNK